MGQASQASSLCLLLHSPLTNANQPEVPDATEGVTTNIRVNGMVRRLEGGAYELEGEVKRVKSINGTFSHGLNVG
jgi:hypothetical protein